MLVYSLDSGKIRLSNGILLTVNTKIIIKENWHFNIQSDTMCVCLKCLILTTQTYRAVTVVDTTLYECQVQPIETTVLPYFHVSISF